MAREAHIPVALWACAAIVAHAIGGGASSEVAAYVIGKQHMREVVELTRMGVRKELDEPLEIDLLEIPELALVTMPAGNAGAQAAEDTDAADETPEADTPEPRVAPPEPKKKPEEKKEEPEKDPEPEPEKQEKEEAPAEAPKPIEMQQDRRIAVVQDAEDNQPDNPDAPRIADEANHVDEEMVARIRAYDGGVGDTSPGTRAGSLPEMGNASETEAGHMDDIEGDPSQAPGQKAYDPSRSVDSGPAREQPTPPQPAQPAAGGDGRPAGPAQPSPSPQAPAAVPQAPGGAGAITPDSLTADNGAYSLDPANPGGDGRAQRKPTPPQPYVDPALSPRALGLGGSGLPGVANLTAKAFEDVVGEEQLRKERLADGAARRAKHRGSFDYGKFQKYLPNVENYEPSVKLGNTTSLNAAQVPFASYLNAMHNRIHPVFAVEFLSTLDGLGPTDPMNGHLVTHLEIVLSGDDGRLVRMGVTKTSGVTAYDMSAMSSIERAGPYGPAPDMIKSPDGNVYLHWEFHRDPFHACSSRNAKPYLLKNPPKIGEAVPTPPKPPAPRKEGDPPPPLLPLRE